MPRSDTASPPAAAPRLDALDGLRGLACAVVVLHHFLLVVPALAGAEVDGATPDAGSAAWWLQATPLHLVWAGHEAVLLFFVLSGFVLTFPLVRQTRDRAWWTAYYPQRLLRLMVPVWAAVAVASVLAVVVRRPGGESAWLQMHHGVSGSTIFHDLTLLRWTSTVDSPLWSLQWELWFSLLLPLVWVALRRVSSGPHWPLLLVALVGVSTWARFDPRLAEAPAGWLLSGLAEYMPVFGIGVVLAVNHGRLVDVGRRSYARIGSWAGTAVALVAVVLVTAPTLSSVPLGPPPLRYAASLVGVTALLTLALGRAPIVGGLRSRPLQWWGARSYSVYLVHEPMLVAAALVLALPAGAWLAAGPVVLVAVLAGAVVFYRAVEAPSHRWARRVGDAVRRRLRPSRRTGS